MTRPKTYIAQSNAEGLALRDGRQTVIVIPFTEQPPAWCKVYWPPHEGNAILCVQQTGESYTLEAPYSIGEVIAVKPEWDHRLTYAKVRVHSVNCLIGRDLNWCWFVEVERL